LSLAVRGSIADWLGVHTLYYIAGTALIPVSLVSSMSPVIFDLEEELTQTNDYKEKYLPPTSQPW